MIYHFIKKDSDFDMWFRLDNLKLKSPDNSTFTRTQFHAFGRD